MKAGFVLIEVLIASLVASIISVALFASFFQIKNSSQHMDTMIAEHEKLALVSLQLERDISGAFIPADENSSSNKKEEKPAAPQAPQQAKPAEQKKKREPRKPITHVFYSVNKDKQLDLLTFITSNPLEVYWSSTAGQPKPRVARVVYRLVPETIKRASKVPSYILMRQEASNLDYDAYKLDAQNQIRSFEVIDGIKELTITFGAELEKKAPAKKVDAAKAGGAQPAQAKKAEKVYQTFENWDMEEKQDKQAELKRRLIPHEVIVTLSLWDNTKKFATTSTFKIPIIADVDAALKEKEDKEEAKPEVQLPQQPAVQQAQGNPGQPSHFGGLPFGTISNMLGQAEKALQGMRGAKVA